MKRRHPNRGQRGLSLATALFVITVMALLAVMIFQLVRSNAETTGEEVLLIRAFYAAESGVQFGLNSVFPPGAGTRSCPATFTLEEDGLAGCEAEVTCTSVTAEDVDYHTITSTGTCGDVSRTIQVRAK
ncbi:MAG TPA: hypothetical protein VGE69_03695 [Pseudomonadales bacterium]